MSFKHSNAVREIEPEAFESAIERYVLIEAAHLADNAGNLHYSQTEIASTTLLSRVTIAKLFTSLEGKGLLKKEKHGQYKVNIFTGKAAKEEPAKPIATQEGNEEPETDEFEEWWENNAQELPDGTEYVTSPSDPGYADEKVLAYEAAGKLERFESRPLAAKYAGHMQQCYIFTKTE